MAELLVWPAPHECFPPCLSQSVSQILGPPDVMESPHIRSPKNPKEQPSPTLPFRDGKSRHFPQTESSTPVTLQARVLPAFSTRGCKVDSEPFPNNLLEAWGPPRPERDTPTAELCRCCCRRPVTYCFLAKPVM